MSEILELESEQATEGSEPTYLPTETVYHGTSVEAAKSILSEGFKVPNRQDSDESKYGPVVWFGTDDTLAHPYGRDVRVRGDDGVLKVTPHDENAPSYGVIIEAEIPKLTDIYTNLENGIQYAGELRLVAAHGIGRIAIKAARLYEYPPHAPYGAIGTLIDEHVIDEKPSLFKRIRSNLRHKRNIKLGRPTLRQ